MDTAEFAQVWRVAWRDLRQQHAVLKLLYEQVGANANARPPAPAADALDTEQGLTQKRQWVEQLEKFTGARDAYATAVVMVVDDLLKRVHGAYKAVPGAQPLTVGCRGVPIPRLFKAAGNNVRHYQDWDRPWDQAVKKKEKRARALVRDNVAVLAQALDHPQPVKTKWLRNYAINLASFVLLEVGGGSYDEFEERIKASLDEMLDNLNARNNVWIQHDLRTS